MKKKDDMVLEKNKREIYDSKTLAFPNYHERFFLQCDASEIGAGCVLHQSHGVIRFYSKKFTENDKNYTTPEKEIFSVFLGLKHYRNG